MCVVWFCDVHRVGVQLEKCSRIGGVMADDESTFFVFLLRFVLINCNFHHLMPNIQVLGLLQCVVCSVASVLKTV